MNAKLLSITTLALLAPFALAQETKTIEDKDARKLVSEFTKKLKPKKTSLAIRLAAVQDLGKYSNKLLVKPLLKVARTDTAKSVQQAAVVALGRQPQKKAREALGMLLKKHDIIKNPDLTAAIVRAYDAGAYTARDYKTFKNMFEKSIADQKCVAAQLAIIELFGNQKEVQAASYLAMHIDAPQPVNVDDPANPPASYWEARWKNWSKWKAQLKETLFKITGQRFGSNKEARTWLRANAKQLKSKASKKDKKKRQR